MFANLFNKLPVFLGLQNFLSPMSRWASSSACPTLWNKLKINKIMNYSTQSIFSQAPSENGFDISLFLISDFSQLARPPKEWDSKHCALVLLYRQPLKVLSSIIIPSQYAQTCWSWPQLFRWPLVIPHRRVEETWSAFHQNTSPTSYHPYVFQRWKMSHRIQH